MPLVTVECSEAEFETLHAHAAVMRAPSIGDVIKAALAAFHPASPADPAPAPVPAVTAPTK